MEHPKAPIYQYTVMTVRKEREEERGEKEKERERGGGEGKGEGKGEARERSLRAFRTPSLIIPTLVPSVLLGLALAFLTS